MPISHVLLIRLEWLNSRTWHYRIQYSRSYNLLPLLRTPPSGTPPPQLSALFEELRQGEEPEEEEEVEEEEEPEDAGEDQPDCSNDTDSVCSVINVIHC